MSDTNDNDARDWIVEYSASYARTWKLPTVFLQSKGRQDYEEAFAQARREAERQFADRFAELEQEDRRIEQEREEQEKRIQREREMVQARIHEARMQVHAKVWEAHSQRDAERERQMNTTGAVTVEAAIKEVASRLRPSRRAGSSWRARNVKTGEIIPGEVFGL